MDWSSLLGAFLGAFVGPLVLIGIIIAWEEYEKRKKRAKKPTLDDVLESHLEQCITEQFDSLFPGWQIYDTNHSKNKDRPTGVRYRTPDAGEIDILCTDREGQFVVIELKRGKASDKVAAQVDRYIAWVSENLAQKGQQVRGLILSRSVDNRLVRTLSQRPHVDSWTFDWTLNFDKGKTQL